MLGGNFKKVFMFGIGKDVERQIDACPVCQEDSCGHLAPKPTV